MNTERCPICLDREGTAASMGQYGSKDALLVNCVTCGQFGISRTALFDRHLADERFLTPVQRAALSHRIRRVRVNGSDVPLITHDQIADVVQEKAEDLLPSPATQAANILAFVSAHELRFGTHLPEFPAGFSAAVGSVNDGYAKDIALQLHARGLLSGIPIRTMGDPGSLMNIGLTLEGWEFLERERRGSFSSNYGFLALDFKNSYTLELKDRYLSPAIEQIGYRLWDMRDISEAGIIDNLMRERIRDSAFVIVDLSDGNLGAYWEGGYAEGLGKPVIYICCSSRAEAHSPHFDVNHCTTVFWGVGEEEAMTKSLIATLRRSLGLFS